MSFKQIFLFFNKFGKNSKLQALIKLEMSRMTSDLSFTEGISFVLAKFLEMSLMLDIISYLSLRIS